MKFIFEQIRVGGDRNFGYLIGDRESRVAVLIDPSYSPETVIKRASDQHLKIEKILNTHGHHDHTNGNINAAKVTGAPIAIYKESTIPHDIGLSDGEMITIGSITLSCYYTPGHCEDHMIFYIPEYNIAITGDHLFVGKIGGTATEESALQQFTHLNQLFDKLPPETTIWPGHDYGCRPSSTLAIEKASNPFVQCADFSAFLALKASWGQLKKEKGLM